MTSLAHEGYHLSKPREPDSMDQEVAAYKAELAAYKGLKAASTPQQRETLEAIEKDGYEKGLRMNDKQLRDELRKDPRYKALPEHSQ